MDSRDIGILGKMFLETDEIERRIKEYDITEDAWFESRALRDLLLMPLLQIGELSAHFKTNEPFTLFPDVAWKDIKGFRNVVVHGYGSIDLNVAWNSVIEGTAELRAELLGNTEVSEAYNGEIAAQANVGSSDLFDLICALPEESELF